MSRTIALSQPTISGVDAHMVRVVLHLLTVISQYRKTCYEL